MAGDILQERRLTLGQTARLLNVHVSTLHRWHLRGVRGVRLSTAVIGSCRYTSQERLVDFINATTAAANGEPIVALSRQREACRRAAKAELDQL